MERSKLLREYRRTFLGDCVGIGLKNRGANDIHVCFDILSEDDENWFVSQNGFSSFWLPELQLQAEEAMNWIKKNCIEETGGWRFKNDSAK